MCRIETLETLQSEDEDLNTRSLDKILSRYSSLDSLNQDGYESHSDDLDKLSICLSEASSESNEGNKKPSIFGEIMQAQLALWTLIGSIFYSYAWQQHRKKFLFSLFVVVPPVAIFCITISSLLTAIVVLGRVFSTPLFFKDVLKYGEAEDETDEVKPSDRHLRTLSINSCQSSVSSTSMVDDYLPRPVCRKHSTSNGSLSQISAGSTSPPNFHCGAKSPPSHRLSYTFTHSTGGDDDFEH